MTIFFRGFKQWLQGQKIHHDDTHVRRISLLILRRVQKRRSSKLPTNC